MIIPRGGTSEAAASVPPVAPAPSARACSVESKATWRPPKSQIPRSVTVGTNEDESTVAAGSVTVDQAGVPSYDDATYVVDTAL